AGVNLFHDRPAIAGLFLSCPALSSCRAEAASFWLSRQEPRRKSPHTPFSKGGKSEHLFLIPIPAFKASAFNDSWRLRPLQRPRGMLTAGRGRSHPERRAVF